METHTIVQLSKYGFKLDSIKNEWQKIDKSLIRREHFLNLKKWAKISQIEKNSGGFIIGYKIEEQSNPIDEVTVNFQTALDTLDKTSHNVVKNTTREQLKQTILLGSLNILSNDINNYDLSLPENQRKAIQTAHSILKELDKLRYDEW